MAEDNLSLSGDSATSGTTVSAESEGDTSKKNQTSDKPLTLQEASKLINSVFTSRTEALEKKLQEKFGKSETNSVSANTSESKKSKSDDTVSKAEFLDLQRQYQERVAKEEKLEAENKDKTLRDSVRDQLSRIGVPNHLMKAAVITLVDANKQVKYDDQGKITMDNLDLESGIKEWSRGDEGKSFISAKGAIGSGEKNNLKASKSQSKISDQQLLQMIMKPRY